MQHLARFGLVLGALAVVAASFAAGVGPGSAAPSLSIKKWLKGTPIKTLDANKTYVVEFWATWCGPCRESIPHLTELAKKNKDVTFIGVGIWEEDKDNVPQKFVDEMGAKMDYNVAYSGNKDGMAESWMNASGQNGIPTAFVVKGGKIQWVGHPMELEKPLAEIKAGTFDLAAHKVKFEQQAEKNRQMMAASKGLSEARKLYDAGKKAEAKALLAETAKKYPSMADQADNIAFGWLAQDDAPAWEAKAKEMAASKSEMKLQMLAMFGLEQASNPKGDKAKARTAVDLAAAGSDEKDLVVLYYKGMVYSQLEDFKGAVDAFDKAIALIPTSQYKGNEQIKTMFEKARDAAKAKSK